MLRRIQLVAAVALVSAAPTAVSAQSVCAAGAPPVAIVESVKNSVQLVLASTKASQPATRRVNVCMGDVIRVGANSRAVILILASNTPLAVDQNSELFVTPPSPDTGGRSLIDL